MRNSTRANWRPTRARQPDSESGRGDHKGVMNGTYGRNRLALTRRHFFGRSANGIGLAALASILGKGSAPRRGCHRTWRLAGAAALRARRRSASSICFNPAARRRWNCSTTSRGWRNSRAQDLPESVRKGQRLTGMSATQSSFPVVPSKFKFAATWQFRRVGQRACCRTPRRSPTNSRSSKSMHTEAINHDPAVTFHSDRLADRGTAEHRRVAVLRHRVRNRRPAGLRRDDFARAQAAAASRSTIACGEAVFCRAAIRA